MLKRTTIRLSEKLLHHAKRKAAAEDRTLSSLIEDALRAALFGRSRSGRRDRRVLPPVSKATGGPMPGVDVTDLPGLQEIDDLKYVERMKRFK